MSASALNWPLPAALERVAPLRAETATELTPPDRTRVLVVIPTLNEGAHIDRLLRSLLADLPGAADVRVVVVDGGSTDETLPRVRALALCHRELGLLHNPGRIQSVAVNLAARRFGRNADVLIRCDAHATYPARFCERLLSTLAREDADAVVVPLDTVGHGRLERAVAWVSNSWVGNGGAAHRAGRTSGFVNHGHHAAFRLDTFRRCGGYDETFSHNEDAEFDCRQRALGARIFLDSETRVGYRPRSGLGPLWRQYFRYGVGRSRTVARHPASLRFRQLLVPANFVLALVGLGLAPWFRLGLLGPAVYLALLAVTSVALAFRHRALCGLLSGPAALVMHGAWACGFLLGLARGGERAWHRAQTRPLWAEPPGESPARASRRLHALLVDPSLFTEPYDAALSAGLASSRVLARWAVRPTRRGQRALLPREHTDAFFYTRVDDAGGPLRAVRPLAKGIAHLLGLAELVRRVRAARPDVVHFQWSVLPLFDSVAIACIRRICPVVVTAHDTVAFNGDRRPGLEHWGADLPLRLADRVVVHTRAGRETLVRRGVPPSKLATLAHGPLALNVGGRAPGPARPDPRPSFVLFGELKHYKGIDVLLDALALLPQSLRGQARFVVAGRPRMELAPIHAQLAALGLEQHVELRAQRLSEEELSELVASADCFLFPYRQIDASGAYCLIKGLGKWIIASNVGIFAEDLRDGVQGNLVPPEDPLALAEAIAHAIEQRPRPETGAAPASWSAIGHATRELYERAIAEHGERG